MDEVENHLFDLFASKNNIFGCKNGKSHKFSILHQLQKLCRGGFESCVCRLSLRTRSCSGKFLCQKCAVSSFVLICATIFRLSFFKTLKLLKILNIMQGAAIYSLKFL